MRRPSGGRGRSGSSTAATADGCRGGKYRCEKSCDHQLKLIVYPIMYRLLYMSGGGWKLELVQVKRF